MIDAANYRTPNVVDGLKQGFEFGNALRAEGARRTAGNALTSGDYGAASNALYGAGMLQEGAQTQAAGQAQQDRATSKRTEALKQTAALADRLSQFHQKFRSVDRTLAAFDQMTPEFQQLGETPEELAEIRGHLQADPDATLMRLGAGAAKELGYEVRNAGDEVLVFDKDSGQLVSRYRGAKTANVADGGALVNVAGDGAAPQTPSVAPPAAELSPAPASADPDAVWTRMKRREWSGKGPAPDSPQGAIGSTQMLPATAEAMARKLGLPWNPGLMRGDTPAALAYQDKLGRAYFEEGLQRYGGDLHKAAAFYHGGPNEAIWGPKTRAYADAVTGGEDTLAGGDQPYEVAANGATPSPPGSVSVLYSRPKPVDPLKDLQAENLRSQIDERRQKIDDGTRKADLNRQGLADKAEIVSSAVDSALSHVGGLTAGFLGGNLAGVKGTPAYNLAREIDTIKANLSFDTLQQMRASSPTGGALGAVSDRELQLLGATVASLDVGQSPDQLRANLEQIKQHYAKWKAASGSTPDGSAPKDAGGSLPPAARSQLKAGHVTTFANGQSWTIRNGQPTRLR